MTNTPARLRGFSLVELMVVIVVAAILLAIALPSFRDVIHRNRVSSASNTLLASLAYARAEAIDRGQFVSICPSTDGANCTPSGQVFDPGWLLYTYPAGAASANKPYVAGTAVMLRNTGAVPGVSIQSNRGTIITFGMQGQLEPALPLLTFRTCYRDSSSGTGTSTTQVPGAELDINGSGSVQTYNVAAGTSCSP